MKQKLLTLMIFLGMASVSYAQKTVYIPVEWQNFNANDTLLYKESDPDNKYTWSMSRSIEGDNVIVMWDKYYGSTSPSKAPDDYSFDAEDLLAKCEEYYDLEFNTIGFDSENLKKYKVMVLMNHTKEWVCYGGGYDFQVSALWLSPSTCKPVGSAVAHEIGHSFHYMCYSDDSNHGAKGNIQTGFHGAVGNGATIWETTANWQALQSYPHEFFTMSGMQGIFPKSHNYAFTHEWHRYQAYPFLSFLCEKYEDIKTVAQVWKQREYTVKDFNQVLMDLKKLSVDDLYKLHFEFAMRAVTWDIEAARPYRNGQIGRFEYHYVKTGSRQYQVAYASAPQATGFNVIPLEVPAAGNTVTTTFTALKAGSSLADGDPAEFLNGNSWYESSGRSTYNSYSQASRRGFRLGYVALMDDGTTAYYDEDKIFCTGTEETSDVFAMEVPDGVARLWLVVSPSPSTYIQHKWDENINNDDQWPYAVAFKGTCILNDSETPEVAQNSVTSLDGLADGDGYFVLQSKETGKFLYFTTPGERAVYGSLTEAQNTATNGYLFSLEKPKKNSKIDANDYVLKVSNGTFNPYVTWDGSDNCLNFNPDGSITFCLANTQTNGRDMVNGGAWDIVYNEAEQAFTLKNIALGKYLSASGASATPAYWYIKVATKPGSDDEEQVLKGDVNGDGIVDIVDVTSIISYILGQSPTFFSEEAADVNTDGTIDIVDVTSTIDIVLGK